MPNYCYANMRVRGYASNVDEFIEILKANYSYRLKKPDGTTDYSKYVVESGNFSHIPHFFRIFETYVANYYDGFGLIKCVDLEIEVAWSVYCCLFSGPLTYYNQFCAEHPDNHFGSCIEIESKRLQLEIEIWSREPMIGFQEHYKICSGIVTKAAEHDGFFSDILFKAKTYEEFIRNRDNEWAIDYVDRDFFNKNLKGEGEYIYEKMVPEEYAFGIEDPPKYLCELVMVK